MRNEEHAREMTAWMREGLRQTTSTRMYQLAECEGVSESEIKKALEDVKKEEYVPARKDWNAKTWTWVD